MMDIRLSTHVNVVFEVIIKERKGGERESQASGSRIAGQCRQQLREWMQKAKRRGDRVMVFTEIDRETAHVLI